MASSLAATELQIESPLEASGLRRDALVEHLVVRVEVVEEGLVVEREVLFVGVVLEGVAKGYWGVQPAFELLFEFVAAGFELGGLGLLLAKHSR